EKIIGVPKDPLSKQVADLHNQLVDKLGSADATGSISSDKAAVIQDMLHLYQTDPHFVAVADASRHYVHNNTALVNASRGELGMEVFDPPQYQDQVVDPGM